eukprot:COSAG06_NODE_19311_length_844_cov_0.927517_1_plen_175_part_00
MWARVTVWPISAYLWSIVTGMDLVRQVKAFVFATTMLTSTLDDILETTVTCLRFHVVKQETSATYIILRMNFVPVGVVNVGHAAGVVVRVAFAALVGVSLLPNVMWCNLVGTLSVTERVEASASNSSEPGATQLAGACPSQVTRRLVHRHHWRAASQPGLPLAGWSAGSRARYR